MSFSNVLMIVLNLGT